MSKKTQPIKIPRLADDPSYQDAQKKLNELEAKRTEISQEISRRLNALKNRAPFNRIKVKAQALLEGHDPLDDSIDSERREIAKLQETEDAYTEAIRQQRQALDHIRDQVNLRLQATYRKLYEPMVKRTSAAAIELARAVDAERQFKSALECQGLSLRPVNDTPSRRCLNWATCDWRGSIARYLKLTNQTYGIEVPDDFLP